MKYTSIVITSYIPNEERGGMFRESIDTLLSTTKNLPVEIIIVDNGGDCGISNYLDTIIRTGEIQCLIHNTDNLHFGFARNQGIAMARGEYLCIADNDIKYDSGWLKACWKVLEAYPDRKFYASPIAYPDLPNGKTIHRYDAGEIKVGEETYKLHYRAGSNCFVIRRKDFDLIGGFCSHRIAGTVWTDKAVHAGFLAAVTPTNLVTDLGLRKGYNLQEATPICRTLTNGEKVYFNQDEYKVRNPDLHYE